MTNSSSETVWLLRAAIQLYGGGIRRALHGAGYQDIPTRGMWAIGAIHRAGGSVSPIELVEGLGVTKQAVSQLTELLESLGYVRRENDPSDGRRRLIALTKQGKRAALVMEDACTVIDMQLASHLGPEVNRFDRLLREVAREK